MLDPTGSGGLAVGGARGSRRWSEGPGGVGGVKMMMGGGSGTCECHRFYDV